MKRLIFTVTTGRSGTMLLSQLMELIPGVSAHHEPVPQFSDVMRLVQKDKLRAERFWKEEKLPKIYMAKEPIYFEASHVFCEGFFLPLLKLGIVPDLVILKRDNRDAALSRWRRKGIPSRTASGRKYLLSPYDPVLFPLDPAVVAKLSDYQLCYWFTLEIDARAKWYSTLVTQKGGIVCYTTLEKIATYDGFARLTSCLRLPSPNPGLYRQRSRVVNAWPDKRELRDIERQEREVRELAEHSVGDSGLPSV